MRMMQKMQNMCKNMDKGDFTPFMKDMVVDDEMMGEMRDMCKNMCKVDFKFGEICQEFMDKFMKK